MDLAIISIIVVIIVEWAESESWKSSGLRSELFKGKWVFNQSYLPPYNTSCPFIDPGFNCLKSNRPDHLYLQYTWNPFSSHLPTLDGLDLLKKWKGKKIMFVGDSLSQNQFESLTCTIYASVPNSRIKLVKKPPFTTVIFQDYGVRVMLEWTPYIVDMKYDAKYGGFVLMLDSITGKAWKGMDALIFNTWHWWTHTGESQPWKYVKEGKNYYRDMNRLVAFYKGLNSWGRWVNYNIDPSKTRVVFQGISPTHYQGQDWNQPTQSCRKQSVPFSGENYPAGKPMACSVVDKVLDRMKHPVFLLDVTALSQYRFDAHPSHYGQEHGPLDCSHWCLPGLPDVWNQLLFAAL